VPADVPDFSPLAATYARARPRYPAALFAWLAEQAPARTLAWDCATGNGQAAVALAAHFERVVATDVSAEQIRHAEPHPRVDYRVAPAEECGLDAGVADLVTVAAAVHWFDLDGFCAEVRRVVRPGGLLAVWSYHAGMVEPPLHEVFHRFYWRRMKPYFAPGAERVDDGYRSLALPGEPLPTPAFAIEAEWTLAQALDYVASWSSVARYRAARGEDPLPALAAELAAVWGDGARPLAVRMPIFLRVHRL
jgi:ubiquinone/menaquinone biosynthesis C-methylase UbiE